MQNTTSPKKLPYDFVKLKSEKTKPYIGQSFFKSLSVNALIMQNTLTGDWFVMKTNNNPKSIFEPLAFKNARHALIYAGKNYSKIN